MLEFQNCSVVFGEGTALATRALDELSVTLPTSMEHGHGHITAVIGANGAGKSTLLNAICGEAPLTGGKILLDNTDLAKLPPRQLAKHFARVFQDPLLGTCADLTIAENMVVAARRGQSLGWGWARSKNNDGEFVHRLAEVGIGLEDRLNEKVGRLSGGQRQILSVIMATLQPATMLLLDEHTAALDPGNATTVMEYTMRIAKQKNLSVLMITHSMQHAIDYGNTIMFINRGKVIEQMPNTGELQVADLVDRFARKHQVDTDRVLLS